MHKHMQITEVSNLTKRHADNSGNHADLRPLKISATARSNSLSLKFLLITQHEGSLINTSKATKKFKLPNRERKMYKCHEPQESFTGCQPHFTTICVCRTRHHSHGQLSEQNEKVLFGDRSYNRQAHDQETE